jgi:hypothetical protein
MVGFFEHGNDSVCRTQRPSGLRHELSLLARTLELWVRIAVQEWMSVCVYSVCVAHLGAFILFVLSCV